jgi:ribosome-associated protein
MSMLDDDPPADEELEQGPSRSAVKRDHLALQALAEQLTTLPRADVDALGFGDATQAALDETARIKDRRALRRHYKRIANCLARENTEPLAELLAAREAHAREAAARHHQIERWRERLIAEGDAALTELFDRYPSADRQALRQLMRAAQRDTERGRPDAPRRLFRALRQLIEAS